MGMPKEKYALGMQNHFKIYVNLLIPIKSIRIEHVIKTKIYNTNIQILTKNTFSIVR